MNERIEFADRPSKSSRIYFRRQLAEVRDNGTPIEIRSKENAIKFARTHFLKRSASPVKPTLG
jgi:hypothetical protein